MRDEYDFSTSVKNPYLKSAKTTVAIRLDKATVKAKLEAVAGYVSRKMSALEGVEQGLADAAAGRLIDHDQVMDEIDRIIAEAGEKLRA